MNAQNLSVQAQAAQAAYASLTTSMSRTDFEAALRSIDGGFSITQATRFADAQSVVLQYNDDAAGAGGVGSSLSVTVFKNTTGQLTLAIRGTLEPGDLTPSDTNIASMGVAYDQVAALYNWWQRVSTPAGQQVKQFRVRPVDFSGTSPLARLINA